MTETANAEVHQHPEKPWRRVALLCTAQLIDVLGVTILAVALPDIQRALELTQPQVGWLASMYALFFGGFLLVSGRAADLYGPKRMFMSGLALFALASLASGLAPSFTFLLTARALQGLGAALQVPAALSLLTDTFPEGRNRTRALAVWTAAAAAGGVTGFALGGPLTEWLNWRWIFLLNVPLGFLGLLLAPRLLAEKPRDKTVRHLDSLGAVLGTAGILALVAGLTGAEARGFLTAPTLLSLGAATILLGAFALVERTAPQPLLPLGALRAGPLKRASLVAFTLTATTSSSAILNILYLQGVLGFSPALTGLVFITSSASVIAGSALGSPLSERLGFSWTMALGLVGIAAALGLYTLSSTSSGPVYVLVGLALSGLGLGCASVASTAAALDGVAPEKQGVVSGFVNTAAQLGTALGIVVFMALATARTGTLQAVTPGESALLSGYHWAFGAAALLALAVVARLVFPTSDAERKDVRVAPKAR